MLYPALVVDPMFIISVSCDEGEHLNTLTLSRMKGFVPLKSYFEECKMRIVVCVDVALNSNPQGWNE